MPLDIAFIRNNPDIVIESQKCRFKPVEDVENFLKCDKEYREAKHSLEQLNAEKNKISKEIGQKSKKGENVEDLKTLSKEIQEKIEKGQAKVVELEKKLHTLVGAIGNIVHDSVPVSNDEDKDNLVVTTWGEMKKIPGAKHHHELLHMIDGYEPARGVKVAGHRAYFLKGVGVQLNIALINYGLAFLGRRGYTPLQTPFFMKKNIMAKTAELASFDEDLYKVSGESTIDTDKINEDEKEMYMIATSEQPISAFHQGEWLEPKSLPLKYAGFSTCFRKEAGSHGKDTWGIFRVHQFEKIEQFCITAPGDSWEMHEKMLDVSKEFYQSLGIPYRVVCIVSGTLNNAAAKKYDLEGWFPSFETFRELVSCSNCTDYQSRALEVRYRSKNVKEKAYVHMLNGTLCATTRTICAILENYQTEKGIIVPEVLQPFMGGLDFIPFVQEPPKTQ